MVIAPRLRLALATAVACAIAALVAVALAADDGGGQPSNGFAGALRPPNVPPQDFALADQDGKIASLREYRGTPVILTFLYTTCEDTCPTQAQAIRGALDRLGEDVPALAISVDPANDTQRSARRFLAKQRVTGRLRFLLGETERLRPIWRAYGIREQKAEFEHSAYVLLIDRRGVQRIGFPADKLTPEALAHDLRRLLAERV